MKKTIIGTILSASFAAGTVLAAESDLGFNAALTSDYRYRGISQTRLQPALQGGVDLVHAASGWYVGAWASTITWTRDAGGDGAVEIDMYGGKRGELLAGLGYDVGVLTYVYPSNGLKELPGFVNADSTEMYVQLGHGPVLLKYSHAVTDLFGFVDSKHSGYLDFSASVEAGTALVLNLHAGRQRVSHHAAASYTDWKIGLARDFGVFTGALAYLGTNAGKAAYASPANGKFLGRSALVLTISKTF